MKTLFALFQLIVISAALHAQQPRFVSDSLDNYIQEGMQDWELPGLSLVIVKDGKVVLMKGYGVRDITTKEKVDEETLFMIASNTKLFTGTTLALLDYQKRMSLDDKITKYFPDYKLYDKASTGLVSVRDMLSHRIGTSTFQGDFTFWNSHLTRAEVMKRMRLLKPAGIFRQDYGYCNSCFLTAGEVAAKVLGMPWEKFVQDSILNLLSMTSSIAAPENPGKYKNVATPYTNNYSTELTKIPYDEWYNLGPAASIMSNVKDLANWLQFQLDSGRFQGKEIMPFAVLQKTRDVNIITTSRKSSAMPMHFRGYGLGLFAADYNGRQIYWHTGGAGGMLSNVCFVPEERLGIAILTNNDNQIFFESLRYQLLDAYLGVKYVNRSKQGLEGFRNERKSQLEQIENWNKAVGAAGSSPQLSPYAGEYANELYGTITITAEENFLKVRFNSHDNLTATLRYMGNDDWLLQYDNIEYGIFSTKFTLKQQTPTGVTIKMNEFVEMSPYQFKKIK